MKTVLRYVYQVYVWLVLMPIALVYTLLSGWAAVLAAKIWNPETASREIAPRWARLICWLTPAKAEVEGADNADPGQTYVVVCNHQSQYDIFLVYGWLKLDLKWVLKAELRKMPGVGIGCASLGHIFVERGNPEQTRKAVDDALNRVGNGVGILFFAEGTRSQDGRLLPFKKGAFRFATSQQLPILPVTIIGARDIQRANSLLIFPGKMRMVIHPAIQCDGNWTDEDIPQLMEQTRATIASALPEELR
jgi:1-acyl-sn-glycerol-3-phosphate acyltransferase